MKFSFISTETKRRNIFNGVKEIKETPKSIKIYCDNRYVELGKSLIGEYNIELDLQE